MPGLTQVTKANAEDEPDEEPASEEQTAAGPFIAIDETDPNWLVACVHTEKPETYGLVNGAHSPLGAHISHVRLRMNKPLCDAIKAKRANKGAVITLSTWDAHCAWFVVARVNKPTFDSQCKEKLVGFEGLSSYTPPEAFITKLAASPIATAAAEDAKAKTDRDAARKTDGKKARCGLVCFLAVVVGSTTNTSAPSQTLHVSVSKLYDATWAGGPKSKETMLILTEVRIRL